MDQEEVQNDPIDPPTSLCGTIIVGHVPIAELGIIPFTPSKHHTIACLDTIFFYKAKKTIARRSEK